MNKKIMLSIAGSDPIAGAGIQTDLKTADRLGVYGCSVVTVITAQNSCGVISSWPMSPDILGGQLLAVLDDLTPDAVKIGMLGSKENINIVSKIIKTFRLKNIVLDPILTPTLGGSFNNEDMLMEMIEKLFPLCDLVTPNLPEVLSIEKISQTPIKELAKNILIKGGHAPKDDNSITDILIMRELEAPIKFTHEKIETPNSHGSGCVISSAIACQLSKGDNIQQSVEKAIEFICNAFKKNKFLKLGKCNYGPTLF